MVTKLALYEKLINVPNFMVLLKNHVWPAHGWEIFSEEEQKKALTAPRCNTPLDVSKFEEKLSEYGCKLPDPHNAKREVFIKINKTNKENNGNF
ncbi:hypothetical protein AbraIFM66950_009212 [Aspergillus brasiliensis]|nr:hypothetical protein AbraIFM66950_009212 [Aspergillus brasiliensis]